MPEGTSRLEEALSSPIGRRVLRETPHHERELLAQDWSFISRPKQRRPQVPGWLVWLLLCGRGFGKTITGSQVVKEWASVPRTRIAIVAPTSRDCRETIARGKSGILAVHPKRTRPHYSQSHQKIIWRNGSQAFLFSALEPERFRGPEFHHAWIDEAAACPYIDEAWKILINAVRLGDDPQIVITTTPKPIPFLHERLAERTTIFTRGSSWENEANLSRKALKYWRELYGGTTAGREQLEGELLGSNEGARFQQDWFDAHRTLEFPFVRDYTIAIDPSSSEASQACECGIVGGGIGKDGACYVLHDESMRGSPGQWIKKVQELAAQKHAKKIVYEANYGKGFLDELFRIIAPELVPKLHPVHATKDKWARAEPVSALAENGRLRMFGHHLALESQASTWEPGTGMKSPDRMDAMVWLALALMIKPEPDIHLENRNAFF